MPSSIKSPFDALVDQIASGLGVPSPSGSLDLSNGNRMVQELRREYQLSENGSRDALWSLARAITEAEELVYIETAGLARTARAAATAGALHQIDLIGLLAQRMQAQPNLKVVICTPKETDFGPPPFARRAMAMRKEAVEMLTAATADGKDRVAAFHPRGFPGRFVKLRSTTVIVDDVWSLTGATHFRRRGMTFDGSLAVASFDRSITAGYSTKVQAQRRGLMASKLGVGPLDGAGLPDPDFIRLGRPASAFDLISDLLRQGGLGKLDPLWVGPTDMSVTLQTEDVADPDGATGAPPSLALDALLSGI